MTDLFDAAPRTGSMPLAAELRPATLDDVIGQEKVIGPGTMLRRRIAAGRLGSIILYGPPGLGKTSIARAIGNMLGKNFRPLHAAHNNVADIRKIADEARMRPTLLFADEVHRFSATQQDHLLALCEEGVADFIGATTGNPYHTLTPALISRSTILKLEPLAIEEMEDVVRRGLRHLAERGIEVRLEPAMLRRIAGRSGGDARRALTVLESLAVGHAAGEPVIVTEVMVEEAYAAAPVNHDRSGDAHYDVVSAFVKSMRGSDPDATLYWLARLVHGGEDPRYIARRIMIHASEDVGLADNTALQTAVAALHAVEKIGNQTPPAAAYRWRLPMWRTKRRPPCRCICAMRITRGRRHSAMSATPSRTTTGAAGAIRSMPRTLPAAPSTRATRAMPRPSSGAPTSTGSR
jgi:putative ATPase